MLNLNSKGHIVILWNGIYHAFINLWNFIN